MTTNCHRLVTCLQFAAEITTEQCYCWCTKLTLYFAICNYGPTPWLGSWTLASILHLSVGTQGPSEDVQRRLDVLQQTVQ